MLKQLVLWAFLLTGAALAAPTLRGRLMEQEGHLYLQVHAEETKELELLTPWDPKLLMRLTPVDLILSIPDTMPELPPLFFKLDGELLKTTELDLPRKAGPL